MPFFQKDGEYIFYKKEPVLDDKVADTIILIHTNIMDHTIFNSMLPFLRKEFHVVTYDLRGFGSSDLGVKELSLDLYVEDLRFLMTSLKLNSVHLVGIGFGALIALKFTTLYKDIVKKIVLMTVACFPEESYDTLREHRHKISQAGTKIPADTLIKKVTSLEKDDPEYERLHQIIRRVSVSTYMKIMDLTLYTNPIPLMNKVEKKTLILSGERERVFPQHLLAFTASYLKNIHFTVVPNATSFIMVDQPEIISQLVKEFLMKEKKKDYTDDMLTNTINENVRLYTEKAYKEGTKSKQAVNNIRVDFLYSFQVEINNNLITDGWNQRYAKQILLFLILHRTTTREQLSEQLWPETPLSTSKRNLRVYLHHLKKMLNNFSLQEPILTIDREHIYINGVISSDALLIMSYIQQATTENKLNTKYELTEKIFSKLNNPSYLTTIFDDWFLILRDNIEYDLINLAIWKGKWLIDNKQWEIAKHYLQKMMIIFDGYEEISDLQTTLYKIMDSHLM